MTEFNSMRAEDLATLPLDFRDGMFAGKTVVVSGGGRGIGHAIAFQFARLGAKVAILGRDEARLLEAAKSLRTTGATIFAKAATIRDPEQVDAFMSDVWTEFGGIDILVNNAGGQYPQAAMDFSPKGWNAVVDTNLNGTWYMTQAAGRRWRDAGTPGSVVSIVAVVSRGMPGVAHSCAARAAVISLSQTLAIEWAPYNIRLNCVAPGIIATEGMNVYSEEARADLPKANLMKRFGAVADIANAVCYLAGPTGSFITGEVLTVDGGYQLWGDQWTIKRPDYFAR
jgi:citronellol/citronellal dehydrogenase